MCHRPVLVEFFGVALLHCSAAFHMFYYSVVFTLFYRFSVFCSSVFRWFWFYSMPKRMMLKMEEAINSTNKNKVFYWV